MLFWIIFKIVVSGFLLMIILNFFIVFFVIKVYCEFVIKIWCFGLMSIVVLVFEKLVK